MSALKEQLIADMKTAMREKDSARLEVIRLLRAAVQRKEVDDRVELDDEQVLAVIQKQIKQANDSITQFTEGGRDDLADKEKFGLEVMQQYMPEQLSAEELQTLVTDAISKTGAESIKDMGKVIGMLKPKVQGRADMGQLSQMIKSALNV